MNQWKIMTKFVGLRAKTCSYIIDDTSEDKNAKGTNKCVIKGKVKFQNYKNCLEATQLEDQIGHLEKNRTDMQYEKIKKRIYKKQQINTKDIAKI